MHRERLFGRILVVEGGRRERRGFDRERFFRVRRENGRIAKKEEEEEEEEEE